MAKQISGPSSPRRWEPVVFWMLIAAAAGFYFWTADLSGAARFSRNPDGSYNLQAEGFRMGHLNMAVDPNPALLALADPYDPVANAPFRIHDLTLWKGKYYLYFGVAPVLLVFLPFRLLTGHYVIEPMVVALFTSIGLLISARLLFEIRRRWFPASHPLVFLSLVAVMGFGCPALFLDQMPQFYQVPISCAYAFAMGALFCVSRVLASRGPSLRWLLGSGICMGMTLASRPNYLLATPLLLLPVWWRVRGGPAGWEKWRRPAAIAFGPVAAVGMALLAYNYLRFGNPFEFGMRYQLAGQSFVNFTPLAVKYLAPHFAIYAWKQIWWLPYFPFVESEPEAPFGVMRYLPVVWLGLAAFWHWGVGTAEERSSRLALAGAIFWLGAANLCMDSVFFFSPELRYVSDFAPAFLLLGAVGALSIAQWGATSRGAAAALLAAAIATVAMVSVVYVQRMPDTHKPARLARLSNRVAAAAGSALGQRYGRLRLEVELPQHPGNDIEPLFQTGHGPDRRDWLQVHYLPQNQARLGLFHAGLGEILAAPVAVPADRRLVIEVDASAFLPPSTHPFFASWPPDEVSDALRTLAIRVNGAPVLEAALPCYPSRPWDLQLGITGFPGDAARERFSGRIVSSEIVPARREAPPPRELADLHGILDLRMLLPALRGGFEPLVASGERSKGQLLYLVYGPNHTVQFALDTMGGPKVFSRPLTYAPAEVINLRAWMGAWATGKAAHPAWLGTAPPGIERRLFLSINGMVLLDEDHAFNPGADFPIAIGWNRVASEAAQQEFSGRVLAVGEEPLSGLPHVRAGGRYGAVDMSVVFPTSAPGQTEPLVATGVSGAGDILYVRYVDEGHVVFGLETWGSPGPSTDPLPVDYGQPQHIEISMGSMFPPGASGTGRRLLVRFNGQVVLDGEFDLYPSTPDEVQVGFDPIGGPTCGWEFTGKILSAERPQTPPR